MQDCIFCKIVAKEIPSKIIAETDDVLVIEDIAPKAPVHYLIISKKHIKDMQSLEQGDASVAANMLFMARDLSLKLPAPGSFRLIANNGAESGQSVFHVHMHFISGKKMTDF